MYRGTCMKKNKFFISLIIFSLVGQIAWVIENMYFNVFISKEFGASQFEVALMVSLSAIIATLTTLFIGSLSDKIQKRKIFIWLGYIIWGISILRNFCSSASWQVKKHTKNYYFFRIIYFVYGFFKIFCSFLIFV